MNLRTFKLLVIGLVVLSLSIEIRLKHHSASAQQTILPPEPPNFSHAPPHDQYTNSSTHVVTRRILLFRKECTECTNIVSSTDARISSRDSVKCTKTYHITFHCSECGEEFVDEFTMPMKRTQIESVTVKQ